MASDKMWNNWMASIDVSKIGGVVQSESNPFG